MKSGFEVLLIANRGEVAIRIARAAAGLGIKTISVHADDDVSSLHRKATDVDVPLHMSGPRAYLDIDRLIDIARIHGASAIHPGYGFLSENADFAERCRQEGLIFIGPSPEVLRTLGDKTRALGLARSLEVPVLSGSPGPVTLEEAIDFMKGAGGAPVILKAVSGGGGRGMRLVRDVSELPAAFRACQGEAQLATGSNHIYVERYFAAARHVEVQILGDGRDVAILGDRDCSIQIRYQKLVEIAPGPWISANLRKEIHAAAGQMSRSLRISGLCTFEFLVDSNGKSFVFMEANPRVQVEHTVTEEVTGIDLVRSQISVAQGARLEDLGLEPDCVVSASGFAIQMRLNIEPSTSAPSDKGQLQIFDMPSGPGVRVDTFGYTGYRPSLNYDSLLAKIIVHDRSADFGLVADRAYRALRECHVTGIGTNIEFLRELVSLPSFREGGITGRFVDEYQKRSRGSQFSSHQELYFPAADIQSDADLSKTTEDVEADPLLVRMPLEGTLLQVEVVEGESIKVGQMVAVAEAMKMEHEIFAGASGVVAQVFVAPGELVARGAPVLRLEYGTFASDSEVLVDEDAISETSEVPSGVIREELAELRELHDAIADKGRPDAVAKRRQRGHRTARENISDLCDPGSFVEYGALAVAAQRSRHSYQELLKLSPADGFIYGLASVNASVFGAQQARCMVASYDYTVFAGTQGMIGHKKHDRMFALAERARLPVVIFTEGGGGRPNDSDNIGGVNLANPTFWHFARLSGLVPLVGIAAGRCFAGNAALLGCCDVTIATRDASIGMGGPVMVEGAGLGKVRPEEIGPAAQQAHQGVVDLLVENEAEAVQCAKQYLSYFQGRTDRWECAPQTLLRDVIPARRTRAYDVRRLISLMADEGSVLELRSSFGIGAVTALIRIEGRPIGLIANNPRHHAGALGADESDKLARFIQLCDGFDLPIVSLCDTPGIMVGVAAERTALVRRSSRLFTIGANITVPYFTIVTRKAYGLGAMAMGGGSFHQGSFFSVAWPTGEFGSMGLEGQIRLGYRKDLEAIVDNEARQARYEELVAGLYAHGKAVNIAPFLSIDAVIDPAETRHWIIRGLDSMPEPEERKGKKRANIDSW